MSVSIFLILLFLSLASDQASSITDVTKTNHSTFSVEGRITFGHNPVLSQNWQSETRVSLDYGKYIGFIKQDGSFEVDGIPSGSYILEVNNIHYIFETVRVDITSKGKIRARRLNLLQPNAVVVVPYPLNLQPRQPAKYFRVREEWRMTDVLMNPMVIMLLVAFILMMVTPKLTANDPQLQQEMQNMQLPKMQMPDISDFMANMFGGKPTKKPKKAITGSTPGPKRVAR